MNETELYAFYPFLESDFFLSTKPIRKLYSFLFCFVLLMKCGERSGRKGPKARFFSLSRGSHSLRLRDTERYQVLTVCLVKMLMSTISSRGQSIVRQDYTFRKVSCSLKIAYNTMKLVGEYFELASFYRYTGTRMVDWCPSGVKYEAFFYWAIRTRSP